jgi:hypothetical protein
MKLRMLLRDAVDAEPTNTALANHRHILMTHIETNHMNVVSTNHFLLSKRAAFSSCADSSVASLSVSSLGG